MAGAGRQTGRRRMRFCPPARHCSSSGCHAARVSPPLSLFKLYSKDGKSELLMMASGMVGCLQSQVPHCAKTLQAGRPIDPAWLPPDSNISNRPYKICNLFRNCIRNPIRRGSCWEIYPRSQISHDLRDLDGQGKS